MVDSHKTRDLDILGGLEAVELVEELEHGALHLRVAARRAALGARRADRVDLVHEDDRRRVLARHHEQLAHLPILIYLYKIQ